LTNRRPGVCNSKRYPYPGNFLSYPFGFAAVRVTFLLGGRNSTSVAIVGLPPARPGAPFLQAHSCLPGRAYHPVSGRPIPFGLPPDVSCASFPAALRFPSYHRFAGREHARNEWTRNREDRQELPAIEIVVASHHDLKQLLSSDAHQLADAFVDKDRMGSDLLPTITRALSKNGPNHRC
jgi:hypothetical protein